MSGEVSANAESSSKTEVEEICLITLDEVEEISPITIDKVEEISMITVDEVKNEENVDQGEKRGATEEVGEQKLGEEGDKLVKQDGENVGNDNAGECKVTDEGIDDPPSEFFDDFFKNDFLQGLNVVDSWVGEEDDAEQGDSNIQKDTENTNDTSDNKKGRSPRDRREGQPDDKRGRVKSRADLDRERGGRRGRSAEKSEGGRIPRGRSRERGNDNRIHRERSLDKRDGKRPRFGRSLDRKDDNRTRRGRSLEKKDDNRTHRDRSPEKKDDTRTRRERSLDRKDDNRTHRERSLDKKDDNRTHRERSLDRKDDNRTHRERSLDRKDDNRSRRERSLDRKDDNRSRRERSLDRKDDNRSRRERSLDRKDDNRTRRGRSLDKRDDNRTRRGRSLERSSNSDKSGRERCRERSLEKLDSKANRERSPIKRQGAEKNGERNVRREGSDRSEKKDQVPDKKSDQQVAVGIDESNPVQDNNAQVLKNEVPLVAYPLPNLYKKVPGVEEKVPQGFNLPLIDPNEPVPPGTEEEYLLTEASPAVKLSLAAESEKVDDSSKQVKKDEVENQVSLEKDKKMSDQNSKQSLSGNADEKRSISVSVQWVKKKLASRQLGRTSSYDKEIQKQRAVRIIALNAREQSSKGVVPPRDSDRTTRKRSLDCGSKTDEQVKKRNLQDECLREKSKESLASKEQLKKTEGSLDESLQHRSKESLSNKGKSCDTGVKVQGGPSEESNNTTRAPPSELYERFPSPSLSFELSPISSAGGKSPSRDWHDRGHARRDRRSGHGSLSPITLSSNSPLSFSPEPDYKKTQFSPESNPKEKQQLTKVPRYRGGQKKQRRFDGATVCGADRQMELASGIDGQIQGGDDRQVWHSNGRNARHDEDRQVWHSNDRQARQSEDREARRSNERHSSERQRRRSSERHSSERQRRRSSERRSRERQTRRSSERHSGERQRRRSGERQSRLSNERQRRSNDRQTQRRPHFLTELAEILAADSRKKKLQQPPGYRGRPQNSDNLLQITPPGEAFIPGPMGVEGPPGAFRPPMFQPGMPIPPEGYPPEQFPQHGPPIEAPYVQGPPHIPLMPMGFPPTVPPPVVGESLFPYPPPKGPPFAPGGNPFPGADSPGPASSQLSETMSNPGKKNPSSLLGKSSQVMQETERAAVIQRCEQAIRILKADEQLLNGGCFTFDPEASLTPGEENQPSGRQSYRSPLLTGRNVTFNFTRIPEPKKQSTDMKKMVKNIMRTLVEVEKTRPQLPEPAKPQPCERCLEYNKRTFVDSSVQANIILASAATQTNIVLASVATQCDPPNQSDPQRFLDRLYSEVFGARDDGQRFSRPLQQEELPSGQSLFSRSGNSSNNMLLRGREGYPESRSVGMGLGSVAESGPFGMGRDMPETHLMSMSRDMLESRPAGIGRDMLESRPAGMGREMLESRPAGMGREMLESRSIGMGRDMLESRPMGMGYDMSESRAMSMGRDMLESRRAGVIDSPYNKYLPESMISIDYNNQSLTSASLHKSARHDNYSPMRDSESFDSRSSDFRDTSNFNRPTQFGSSVPSSAAPLKGILKTSRASPADMYTASRPEESVPNERTRDMSWQQSSANEEQSDIPRSYAIPAGMTREEYQKLLDFAEAQQRGSSFTQYR